MQNGKGFLCLIQETTTKICNYSFKKLILFITIIFLFLDPVFSQESKKWVIAAEKFSFTKGQSTNSVTEGISETIPKSIMENLNKTLNRNIRADEKLDRRRADLRKKRQSLYLQLSSEVQKRDSLFLNYSGRKLNSKIKEQEEKIADIKSQIDNNLEELKKAEEEGVKLFTDEYEEKTGPVTESERMSVFFKKIISSEKSVVNIESINIYDNDSGSLFVPSKEAKIRGYESTYFSDEMESKGINSLITGEITSYEGYISINVDLYRYPGGKKIGSVMEIGSIKHIEVITSSIVQQLIPLLTNSMPVTVNFSITPYVPLNKVQIYIDDVLQKTDNYKFIINSGVHTFQIVAEGYRSLSTSYFFQGDTIYNIEIKLQEKNEGVLNIHFSESLNGDIFTNGIKAEKLDDSAKIIINGQHVLGEFISEDGNTAFFYIPEKLYFDGNDVKINPKTIDRSARIDTRRKWMYGSYSAFMVSLIPTFITKGFLDNKVKLYNDRLIDYNSAKKWEITYNVFAGVSIGLAVFWGVELVHYLVTANSVLPEKAKQVHLMDLDPGNNEKVDDAPTEHNDINN